MTEKKNNVVPLDRDWHLKLATKKAAAKLRHSLDRAEERAAVRLAKNPKRIVPAAGWADPSERLTTLEELAEHFRVDAATIRRAVRRGELVAEPCGKNGKTLRFSRAAIDAYKTHLARKRYG